jgi:peptide chain release factor subunit 1
VIAIDARDCGWGILRNGVLEVITHTSSGVAGKHGKGGQSQRRYERLREMHLNEYFNRCGETTNQVFTGIKKIVLHGPAFTKHEFIDGKHCNYMIKNKVNGFSDGCYAGEDGLYEYTNSLK